MMPPSPRGSVQEQLVRQYSYLFQMAQQLNVALGQLESGGTAAPSGGTAAPAAEREQQYQTLKSMIVKTADTVQRRMDQLSAKLTGEYVAASEFGTYVERLNAYLEANPEAMTQYYSFFADLQASTETVSAAFEQYRLETEGYIRTGIVCYDGAVPQYGVAVGQNLICREVDGETVVEQNDFRATFTASKLSFWQDASEVAYVSNNRLYITNITVLEGMSIGEWEISSENGLVIRWMGGWGNGQYLRRGLRQRLEAEA